MKIKEIKEIRDKLEELGAYDVNISMTHNCGNSVVHVTIDCNFEYDGY